MENAKKLVKKFLCIFVLACLLIQPLAMSMSAAGFTISGRWFTCRIVSENGNIPLSGIKIDVYVSELVNENVDAGYRQFEETYCKTVITNTQGVARFLIPSIYFSVTVDVDTLPSGYGIDHHTQFYSEGNLDTFYLSAVDDVQVSEGDGELSVRMFNSSGAEIFAPYTSSVSNDIRDTFQLASAAFLSNLDRFTDIIEIDVFGEKYTHTSDILLDNMSLRDKADCLKGMGVIDEAKRIDFYCESLSFDENNNNENAEEDCLGDDCCTCITPVASEILSYYDSLENPDSASAILSETVAQLRSVPTSDYDNAAYVTTTNFKVHYDADNMSAAVATRVANEFESVRSYFCTSNGFLVPFTSSDSSKYEVYLSEVASTTNPDAIAVTCDTSNGGTYIIVGYSWCEGLYNGSTRNAGTFAHEYMHAIMCRYSMGGCKMNEGFAANAGIIYRNSWADNYSNARYEFLLDYSSGSSLATSTYNEYGSLLIPLYIYQEMGGWSTIRSIYNNYTSTGGTMNAINAGVSAVNSSYSLGKVMSGFMAYSCDTQYFYDISASNWGNVEAFDLCENEEEMVYTYGMPRAISPYGGYYTRFSDSIKSGSFTVTSVLTFSGTGVSNLQVKIIGKLYGGSYTVNDATITTVSSTVKRITLQQVLGVSVDEYTIAVANAGSGNFTYMRSTTIE